MKIYSLDRSVMRTAAEGDMLQERREVLKRTIGLGVGGETNG